MEENRRKICRVKKKVVSLRAKTLERRRVRLRAKRTPSRQKSAKREKATEKINNLKYKKLCQK